MTTTDNKEIVLRQWYQQLWDSWNVAVADELFTDDYQLHMSGFPAALNREATKQAVVMFSQSFPDLRHTVDEMVAEGSTVAARWRVRGTHRGEFQGLAPTGKTVSLSGITVHHMAGGRIAETWLSVDNLEMLQQLGALPQTSSV